MSSYIKSIALSCLMIPQQINAQTVQNFTKPDVNGITYTLYDELEMAAKPVVIDFMATWCTTCQAYVPALQKIYSDYGSGDKVWVWAMDIEDSETTQQIKDYETTVGSTFPIFPQASSVAVSYNVVGIPHFVVICPDKTIAYNKAGWNTSSSEQDLRNAIKTCNVWPVQVEETDMPDNKANAYVYPNPATNNINIAFPIESPSDVSIQIYDVLGRNVRSVLNKSIPVGQHHENINLDDLTSGIYTLKLTSNNLPFFSKISIKK